MARSLGESFFSATARVRSHPPIVTVKGYGRSSLRTETFTAVSVHLAPLTVGAGSSTLVDRRSTCARALDLTPEPEPSRAPSSRYRRPDGQVCSAETCERHDDAMKLPRPISVNPRVMKLWPLPLGRARGPHLDTTVEPLETCGTTPRPRHLRTTNTR